MNAPLGIYSSLKAKHRDCANNGHWKNIKSFLKHNSSYHLDMERISFKKRILVSCSYVKPSLALEENQARRVPWHQVLSNISQVLMLCAVVFGYIYTVRPVYLKEKLEEENAQLKLTGKQYHNEIAELAAKVVPLKQKTQDLEKEKHKLLFSIEELAQRKEALEKQMEFMTFAFKYPDGTPATTQTQVKEVNEIKANRRKAEAKLNYLIHFRLNAMLSIFSKGSKEKAFNHTFMSTYIDNETFPFTSDESKINTSEELVKHLKNLAFLALESNHKDYTSKRKQVFEPDSWKAEIYKSLEEKTVSIDLMEPPSYLIKQFKDKVNILKKDREKDLLSIEKEFKGWEKTRDNHKKEILRHNYAVSKLNVETHFDAELYKLEEQYRLYAMNIRDKFIKAYNALIEEVYFQLSSN